MNKVRAYCDAGWSGLSMTVFVGLLATLLYWTVLQRPPLTFNVDGLKTSYVASRGATVYVENPIYPPDTTMSVQINSSIKSASGYDEYRLNPVDTRDGFKPSTNETKLSFVRQGYPVYGVFIPSYVKPGIYTYKAKASYRLNVFRTVTMDLPELTVIVD
jgi:hypothetical protein